MNRPLPMASTPSFWQGYWHSLKPLEVEEPIDVWVHRPLAYLLARASLPTKISPNLITLFSIVLAVLGAVSAVVEYPGHLPAAASCIFLSAVFDCADGQLARLRGTSSAFGRMLDGVADMVVSIVVVCAGGWLIWNKYSDPWWLGALVLGLSAATVVTGSFHTAMYDHYKNVYLRLTTPHFREGEDYEAALQRFQARTKKDSWAAKIAWRPYIFYVRSQREYLARFDPYTVTRFVELPAYSPERAAIYREHASKLMRHWRTWFGFGSIIFGMSVAIAFNVVEYYVFARLLLLNPLFYFYMRPEQRRASQAAFAAM